MGSPLVCLLFLQIAFICAVPSCPSGDSIVEWKKYLNNNFYLSNHDIWDQIEKKRNVGLFNNQYVTTLSETMKACRDILYFSSFGACDGTSDKTIEMYLKSAHWRGVMVEAFPSNIAALTNILADRGALQRSLVLEAAAMEECDGPTVSLRSPVAEPDDSSKPHWLRRQSSSVVTQEQAEKNKLFPKVWKLTDVRCMTGLAVMKEFDSRFSDEAPPPPSLRRRTDILKIDVEGSSVPVLRSVLSDALPEMGRMGALPLMIMVEVKTAKNRMEIIDQGCEVTAALLREHGYDVSPCAQDIFAVRMPTHM